MYVVEGSMLAGTVCIYSLERAVELGRTEFKSGKLPAYHLLAILPTLEDCKEFARTWYEENHVDMNWERYFAFRPWFKKKKATPSAANTEGGKAEKVVADQISASHNIKETEELQV